MALGVAVISICRSALDRCSTSFSRLLLVSTLATPPVAIRRSRLRRKSPVKKESVDLGNCSLPATVRKTGAFAAGSKAQAVTSDAALQQARRRGSELELVSRDRVETAIGQEHAALAGQLLPSSRRVVPCGYL